LAKSKKIFIGLEDSKRTWVLCVRSDKSVIHELSMPARYGALRKYLAGSFEDCEIHVVYEAGYKGYNLYYALTADGYGCTVVPPHTVQQEKCAKVKNDRADARVLAKNLEDGNCKACLAPDKERRSDRQIVRALDSVITNSTRVKNQIRKFLDNHGIETGIEAQTWTDNHYKYIKTEILPGLDRALRLALGIHLEDLERYQAQRKLLKDELAALSKKERYARAVEIARSLPGIGPLTAIRLILEFGEDFTRFRSGAHIASFVGLGGAERSSGERERKGGITKQGSARIRSWLIESAWAAIRKDPALQAFYTRVKANAGNYNKAITAVARKLVTRLRSCVVNDTEYVFGVIA
jgi:transposase